MLVIENTGQCEGAWRLYWASIYELSAPHTRYIQVIGSPHPRADDHCCGGAGMQFYVAAVCLHHHLLLNQFVCVCWCASVVSCMQEILLDQLCQKPSKKGIRSLFFSYYIFSQPLQPSYGVTGRFSVSSFCFKMIYFRILPFQE